MRKLSRSENVYILREFVYYFFVYQNQFQNKIFQDDMVYKLNLKRVIHQNIETYFDELN